MKVQKSTSFFSYNLGVAGYQGCPYMPSQFTWIINSVTCIDEIIGWVWTADQPETMW